MGFTGALLGGLKGFDQAAGAPQAAAEVGQVQDEREQKKHEEMQQQIAPLTLASSGLQRQIQDLTDPATGKPYAGKEARYTELTDQLQDIIGKTRMILHPPPKEDPHGLSQIIHNATDRLHITRDAAQKAREANANKVNSYYQNLHQQVADQTGLIAKAGGGNPLTPEQQTEAARVKAGIEPKAAETKPNLANFRGPGGDIKLLDKNDPKSIPSGYVLATSGTAEKPAGPLEVGGVAYGVRGADGKEYLPDAKGNFPPGTPPEVIQIYATIKAAQQAKEEAADKKAQEAEQRQLRGLATIAERQGRSEVFQEQMAEYRSAETTHRALDKQARDSEEAAKLYSTTADQPGNKSALDLALVADYTSILAKGGRKTQAEFNLARQIGGLGLRTEALLQKAQTGELPPEARKMYVDYLKQRAKSEREEADAAKPDLPDVPMGPKTKSLKNKPNGSLADRLNDALGK